MDCRNCAGVIGTGIRAHPPFLPFLPSLPFLFFVRLFFFFFRFAFDDDVDDEKDDDEPSSVRSAHSSAHDGMPSGSTGSIGAGEGGDPPPRPHPNRKAIQYLCLKKNEVLLQRYLSLARPSRTATQTASQRNEGHTG